jgi:hypothetical protein
MKSLAPRTIMKGNLLSAGASLHLQGGTIGAEAANTDVNEVFEFSEK